MKSKLPYLMALTYVPGIGPMNQRKVLKAVEVDSLWSMTEKELKEIFRKRPEFIPYFQSNETLDLAHREIEYCKQNNIDILTYHSENYPQHLKNCIYAHLVLFSILNYKFVLKLFIVIF